ncbi:MAG: hypothetical protein IH989_04735 [Planctomycetes bacterium]|nr:hypothetical protein [Planctomycetota bacterium]
MTAPALAVCVAVTVTIAQRPTVVSAPAEHPVELVTTRAVRLVFLEHDGPYWAAGAKFADVRDYMSLHDQSGSMFMLYPRSTRGLPRTPVSLIGFIAERHHIPRPPFRAKTLAARRVVRLMVEGKAASPRRPLRTIDRWAAENGHSPSGEVLEIYHLAPDAARRIERTEFQLFLTVLPIESPSDTGKLDDQAPEPESPSVVHRRPAATKPVVPPTPSISVELRSEAKAREGRVIDSIPALVRAARYDRVAALVLPDARGIDRDEQIWIGQVIFRIKAAGRGLDRKYPKSDGATTALAEALAERYRKLFQARPADLLIGATAASAQSASPRGTERRAIMRQLDALLSRIAFAAAPDTVADEVAEHLERARRVLKN